MRDSEDFEQNFIGYKDGLLILAFLLLTIPGLQLRGRHLLGGLFGGFLGIFFGRFKATPSGSFRTKGRARLGRQNHPANHRF